MVYAVNKLYFRETWNIEDDTVHSFQGGSVVLGKDPGRMGTMKHILKMKEAVTHWGDKVGKECLPVCQDFIQLG